MRTDILKCSYESKYISDLYKLYGIDISSEDSSSIGRFSCSLKDMMDLLKHPKTKERIFKSETDLISYLNNFKKLDFDKSKIKSFGFRNGRPSIKYVEDEMEKYVELNKLTFLLIKNKSNLNLDKSIAFLSQENNSGYTNNKTAELTSLFPTLIEYSSNNGSNLNINLFDTTKYFESSVFIYNKNRLVTSFDVKSNGTNLVDISKMLFKPMNIEKKNIDIIDGEIIEKGGSTFRITVVNNNKINFYHDKKLLKSITGLNNVTLFLLKDESNVVLKDVIYLFDESVGSLEMNSSINDQLEKVYEDFKLVSYGEETEILSYKIDDISKLYVEYCSRNDDDVPKRYYVTNNLNSILDNSFSSYLPKLYSPSSYNTSDVYTGNDVWDDRGSFYAQNVMGLTSANSNSNMYYGYLRFKCSFDAFKSINFIQTSSKYYFMADYDCFLNGRSFSRIEFSLETNDNKVTDPFNDRSITEVKESETPFSSTDLLEFSGEESYKILGFTPFNYENVFGLSIDDTICMDKVKIKLKAYDKSNPLIFNISPYSKNGKLKLMNTSEEKLNDLSYVNAPIGTIVPVIRGTEINNSILKNYLKCDGSYLPLDPKFDRLREILYTNYDVKPSDFILNRNYVEEESNMLGIDLKYIPGAEKIELGSIPPLFGLSGPVLDAMWEKVTSEERFKHVTKNIDNIIKSPDDYSIEYNSNNRSTVSGSAAGSGYDINCTDFVTQFHAHDWTYLSSLVLRVRNCRNNPPWGSFTGRIDLVESYEYNGWHYSYTDSAGDMTIAGWEPQFTPGKNKMGCFYVRIADRTTNEVVGKYMWFINLHDESVWADITDGKTYNVISRDKNDPLSRVSYFVTLNNDLNSIELTFRPSENDVKGWIQQKNYAWEWAYIPATFTSDRRILFNRPAESNYGSVNWSIKGSEYRCSHGSSPIVLHYKAMLGMDGYRQYQYGANVCRFWSLKPRDAWEFLRPGMPFDDFYNMFVNKTGPIQYSGIRRAPDPTANKKYYTTFYVRLRAATDANYPNRVAFWDQDYQAFDDKMTIKDFDLTGGLTLLRVLDLSSRKILFEYIIFQDGSKQNGNNFTGEFQYKFGTYANAYTGDTSIGVEHVNMYSGIELGVEMFKFPNNYPLINYAGNKNNVKLPDMTLENSYLVGGKNPGHTYYDNFWVDNRKDGDWEMRTNHYYTNCDFYIKYK